MITEIVYLNRFFLAKIGERDFFVQDGFIECRDKAGDILFISDEIGGEYIFECTDLFVRNSEAIRVFDGVTGKFKTLIKGYELFENSLIADCNVLVNDYRESQRRLTLLNLKNEFTIWTIEFKRGSNFFVDDCTVYLERYRDKKYLYAINLKNGDIRWQFDISQFGFFLDYANKEEIYSLVQIVGVLNNLLWVVISGGRLLALNTQTGQLIHELNFNEIFGEPYHAGPRQMFLDKVNKRIIWVRSGLVHIDLVSLKCTVVKEYFNGLEKEDRWLFTDKILHNNKVFFSGDHGMHNPIVATFLGIMNADTGEIIWDTQLLKCDGISHFGLHVSGNRIYARDGKRNLHVFEQEVNF